jgi:hypothetical protein
MLEDMVASLISEEMRRKNMEGSTKYALVVRGRLVDRYKGRFSGRKHNSKGRSKSWFIRCEDAGNAINLGIIKRTISRRKHNSVSDSTRSSQLRK